MRNLPWKKIAVGAVGVAIVAIGVFYFTTGRSAKPSSFINPAFGEYISSYTAGVVPSGSYMRIVLASEVADSASIGQESSSKLFDFSPSLKGKAVWLDARTIEFRPDSRMTSGQVYVVKFELAKLMKVPDELKVFEYTFQVIPQNYEITVDNVKPYVKTELQRQKVEGTLTTADFAENDAAEKTISATQEGKSLKITWTHAPDGKQHAFVVEDVARKEQASVVKISTDGKALGISNTNDYEVEIPALGDFKVMHTKIVQNPSQYVILQFSDPLKEKQNLDGLISIGDNGNLTLSFEVHDNEIWVYPPVRQTGTKTIYIERGVRNINDAPMQEASTVEVVFEQLKPAVRFLGKGAILPSTDGLILPFEAVNLNAVDVSISKVFENNITQFLQVNNLEGSYEMHRVGRNVLRKKIQLDNAGVTDLGKWNRFTLDLATLINTEPGAIYQITLDFNKDYTAYICEDDGGGESNSGEESIDEGYGDYEGDGYYDEEGNYYEDYDALIRLLRIEPRSDLNSTFTREEVGALVVESRDVGLLGDREFERLSDALDFTARAVDDVMLPLDSLDVVRPRARTSDIEDLCARTGYSRFPVRSDDGTMLGYIHIKDVLSADAHGRARVLEDAQIRPFANVVSGASLVQTLTTLQTRSAHLALVRTDDGIAVGIAALEDVIEELVGTIRDQFSDSSDNPPRST